MPTFAWLACFGVDFDALTPTQQAEFLLAVTQFVEDLRGATGIFELTWADNGRATFEYGDPIIAGEPHIVWRRVGTHAIFRQP